jgi:hypothetical protein
MGWALGKPAVPGVHSYGFLKNQSQKYWSHAP